MSNKLIIYPNCIIVKGQVRSVICDLQFNRFDYIPNSLAELFDNSNNISVNSFRQSLSESDLDTFDSYLKFLVENKYGFLTKLNVECQFQYDLTWDNPSFITNCIIDYSENISLKYYEKVYYDLEVLGCKTIVFRFDYVIKPNALFAFLMHSLKLNSRIISYEIYLPYNVIYTDNILDQLKSILYRIRIICFYNYKENLVYHNGDKGMGIIILIKEDITIHLSCGLILPDYFHVNEELFTEAQKHNTCLNRKISIDVNGEIKNCPSMAKSYGNIKDTTLAEALEKIGFKDLWFINKDKIHVCSDCEFRYICTDCRAYIENPEDIFSKPLKCGYNPYTADWEEWSINPLKQKAIEYYGMKELVIKEK